MVNEQTAPVMAKNITFETLKEYAIAFISYRDLVMMEEDGDSSIQGEMLKDIQRLSQLMSIKTQTEYSIVKTIDFIYAVGQGHFKLEKW
jgi:hypothetical protein